MQKNITSSKEAETSKENKNITVTNDAPQIKQNDNPHWSTIPEDNKTTENKSRSILDIIKDLEE